MKKIGFIGMGNMGKAIAAGFISKGVMDKANIFAYAPNQEKLEKNSKEIGFNPVSDIKNLIKETDIIIVACKPYQIQDVLTANKDILAGKTLVSIAAGWTFDTFMAEIDTAKIQCIMPNTPAMVGEGVFLFEEKNNLDAEDLKSIKEWFAVLGEVVELPTRLMGIGGAVSGCGPAFMDLILEAYADAAVKYGVSRDIAYKLIGKTMLGSAKLMLETGKHPGVLKDEVCSPAGTTIVGVSALEKCGLRNACIESIDAIMNKKMGK